MKERRKAPGFLLLFSAVLLLIPVLFFARMRSGGRPGGQPVPVPSIFPSAAAVSPAGLSPDPAPVLFSAAAMPASLRILSGDEAPLVFPERGQVNVDALEPALIADRRIADAGPGEIIRLFLVYGGGSYPWHRIEERLRYNPGLDRYEVARQQITVADHFLVNLRDGTGEAELEELNRRFGTRTLLAMGLANQFIVQITEPSLDGVADVSARFARETHLVTRVCPDSIDAPAAVPNDAEWSLQWCKRRIGCPEAWDIETGSTNIIIAIIDSGVDLDHPDLAAHLWLNPGEAGPLATNGVDDDLNGYIDDWIGWDFGKNDNNPDDNGDDDYTTNSTFSAGGHGTHCAGIAGAVGNNAMQVAGVCWNVRIMALKPFEYMELYAGMRVYASKAVLAMKYAADHGARITSNSYGGLGNGVAYYEGVNYLHERDVLFVAAAGNDGLDTDAFTYQPACVNLPNVISVGSSSSAEELSWFSNYGANSVDLIAPGSSIRSTIPNGLTGTQNGTSMAAPQAAGAAALLLSFAPDLTGQACKDLLMAGVDRFSAYEGNCVAGGRLNVSRSLDSANGFDIQAPAEGAVWRTGSTQAVQWVSWRTNGLARIDLYRGEDMALTLTGDVPRAEGRLDWVLPDTLEASTEYRIRIENTTNAANYAWSGLFEINGPPVAHIEPAELVFAARSGRSDSAALVISNAGTGELTFSITNSTAGGNYAWTASGQPGGPVYEWIDLSGTGTAVTLSDDSVSGMLDIGFEFPFYGGSYSQFQIGANGGVSLSSGDLGYVNEPLPSKGAPAQSILAFWDDLNPSEGGTVLYRRTADNLTVSWIEVPRYGTPDMQTFQIVLYPDGRIVFQYLTLNGMHASCTVGLQDDPQGGPAVQAVFDQPFLQDLTAIEFVPPPAPWLTADLSAGTVPPAGFASAGFTASAAGFEPGVYTAMVAVISNDGTSPEITVPVVFHVGEADTDDDGLPDAWEILHAGGPTNAVPDALCANGVNTWLDAYVAGFDPNDPDAGFFAARPQGQGDALDEIVLQWPTVTGRLYSVYWSSNLLDGSWIPAASNLTVGVFTDATHAAEGDSGGFYRIDVEMAP